MRQARLQISICPVISYILWCGNATAYGQFLFQVTGVLRLNSSMATRTYWTTRTIIDEDGKSSPSRDIIQEALEELNVSLREFARAMEIAPSTASRLLTGKAALTPEMAIKLSVVIGSSPEMWLNLQKIPSLAEAQKAWIFHACVSWRYSDKKMPDKLCIRHTIYCCGFSLPCIPCLFDLFALP